MRRTCVPRRRGCGAIQIDSVNVLARAHYLPAFSRFGPYPMSALDDLVHGRRELFEYWGHAACFLPIDLYPLMRWRMEGQCDAWAGVGRKQKNFMEAVYREVADARAAVGGRAVDGRQEHGAVVGMVGGEARDRAPVPAGSSRGRGTAELRAPVRHSRDE